MSIDWRYWLVVGGAVLGLAAFALSGCAPAEGVHELGRGEIVLIPAGSTILPPEGERLIWRQRDGTEVRLGIWMPPRFVILLTPLDYVLRRPMQSKEINHGDAGGKDANGATDGAARRP